MASQANAAPGEACHDVQPRGSTPSTDETIAVKTAPPVAAAPLQQSLHQPAGPVKPPAHAEQPPSDPKDVPAPTPPPPVSRSSASRQSGSAFVIPGQLVKPGLEMLKVSVKSARRVKSRRVWLELASEMPEDGEVGLEVGIGVVGGQDVRLCWEKNGPGLGELSALVDDGPC